MIKTVEQKKGVQLTEVWYAKEKITEKGMIRYREALCPVMQKSREKRTLFTDLTESEEEIVNRFGKNCRYEVRRAERENIETIFYKEDAASEIEPFLNFFEQFWVSRGVTDQDYDKLRKELKRYAEVGSLMITRADIEGDPAVYHTYLVDEHIVRLHQSASFFRNGDKTAARLTGVANRYLHKEDMLRFKELGKEIYDWGGAGLREEVASITKFKEEFGGKATILYDGEENRGAAAKLYKIVVKAIGILGK